MDHSFALSPDSMSVAATQPFEENTDSMSQWDPSQPRVVARLLSQLPTLQTYDILNTQNEVLVGRESIKCHIAIKDSRVSKVHCQITHVFSPTGQSWYIQDLSANGTYLNGDRLGKAKMPLAHNDYISLISKKLPNCVAAYVWHDSQATVLKPNEEISQHFMIGAEIGKGNFSTVHVGHNKRTKEKVAIKIINKKRFWNNTKTRAQILREVEIIRGLNHPHIIQYKAVYDSADHLYLVLEIAQGGELYDKVAEGPFPELQARQVFRQMLDAVAYLHSKNITHRDLKPENVLFTDGVNIKISDFGLASMVDAQDAMKTLCGTPQYVAPEIIKLGTNEEYSKHHTGYSNAVDMWSLGVILYILLSGSPPFYEDESSSHSLYGQIEGGQYDFPTHTWKNISREAIDLIRGLLNVDPRKRLTAVQAIGHSWFTAPIATQAPAEAFPVHLDFSTEPMPNLKPVPLIDLIDEDSQPQTTKIKKRKNSKQSMVTDFEHFSIQDKENDWEMRTTSSSMLMSPPGYPSSLAKRPKSVSSGSGVGMHRPKV